MTASEQRVLTHS